MRFGTITIQICKMLYHQKAFREKFSKLRHEKLESSELKKPKCLSNLDVHEFLLSNKIKRKDELFAVAREQYEEGKKDLTYFLVAR